MGIGHTVLKYYDYSLIFWIPLFREISQSWSIFFFRVFGSGHQCPTVSSGQSTVQPTLIQDSLFIPQGRHYHIAGKYFFKYFVSNRQSGPHYYRISYSSPISHHGTIMLHEKYLFLNLCLAIFRIPSEHPTRGTWSQCNNMSLFIVD